MVYGIYMLWMLTCAHKSSRVWVPSPIFTHCLRHPSWSKPWVTSEKYLRCALMCLKRALPWGSGVTTVGCRAEVGNDLWFIAAEKSEYREEAINYNKVSHYISFSEFHQAQHSAPQVQYKDCMGDCQKVVNF